ncbi:MAG: ComF family protein [Deltaproteobacteria bacterium]|nr:ComF family protein [Deltaproteobacteria bacterium]
MPVPLHDDRLRWRGFNQALLLARRVAGATQVSVAPFLLERTRPTQPQVELDETQRRNNVKNAFRAARPELIRNRQFLLVDDVMTTGATADECARTLRTAGARCVDVLALARVVLN